MVNKFWKDCSKEEKSEVREIEKARKELKKDYLAGKINIVDYHEALDFLSKQLDFLERLYA